MSVKVSYSSLYLSDLNANQPNVVDGLRKCDVWLKYLVRYLPGIKYQTFSQFSGQFSNIKNLKFEKS